MEQRVVRGRLEPSASAPVEGERVTMLAELQGVAIEQILSGSLPGPLAFTQKHAEWVLVLAGHARLRVGEDVLELAPGDWLVIPSGCRHSLLETEPGTSWLAVHIAREA
jgi:cupin 2 domain-containing protein